MDFISVRLIVVNLKILKKYLILIEILLLLQLCITQAAILSKGKYFPEISEPLVNHYEPVLYSPSHIQHHSHLFKRNIDSEFENSFNLQLRSHGRDFSLNLIRDDSIFHPHTYLENSDGPIVSNSIVPVTGFVDGEPSSKVHGTISNNGIFDGYLYLNSSLEYYVEPSTRYWFNNFSMPLSIMYHSKDVILPTSQNQNTCQSHTLHKSRTNNLSDRRESELHLKNKKKSESLSLSRKKRWMLDNKKKACMLYLQADYDFYKRFGSEEAAINIMISHIQRLNEIYKITDFDMDGSPDDIQFMIKRVKVHTKNRNEDPSYPFDGHFEVIKFLEVFSEGDYDAFCLAYLFTYRDFEGGTLGLAWTGDLKNAGGVCEKKGHFRGGVKSLNTGIITLLNYGKLVSPAVSHVTLAHEIGHNFGSPHDPDNDRSCTPGGDDGNFIMFARATAGDRRNNNKFSSCSLRSINPVLTVKARDLYGCFQEPQASICGNGVVEEGEECDCGWEEDCRESCCFPMKRRSWEVPEGIPCKLRSGAQCSPSRGPCCSGNCTLSVGGKCREDNGCRNTAYCDGTKAECPDSILKPNKTICDKSSHVCYMGECTGSICLAYGLDSCQCSQQLFDRSTKLCEVCCKLPGVNQSCISSYDWKEYPYDMPNVLAKAGTPCKNYTGYCDSYSSCREIDPSGPLATLRKLLAADEGLASIAQWINNHWYAVIAIIGTFILLLVGTAQMCGRQTKRRLRKLTVLHSNFEAIQVQRSYLEDGGTTVHPTAVRKKIPFKKKVRERRSKSRSRKQQKLREAQAKNKNNEKKSKSESKLRASLAKNSTHGSRALKDSLTTNPSTSRANGSNSQKVEKKNEASTSRVERVESLGKGMSQSDKSKENTIRKVSTPSAQEHELKSDIIKRVSRRGSKDKINKSIKSGSRGESSGASRPPPPPLTKDKSISNLKSHGKRSIQVMYTPPFSVKLELVPQVVSQSKGGVKKKLVPESGEHSKKESSNQGGASSSKQSRRREGVKSTSSNSLLRRRRAKEMIGAKSPRKEGELQILIPTTHEDEEGVTPQPTTS